MKMRKFDLDIYPLATIRQAALDYSHIANILVIPGKKQGVCYFLWCKADEVRTIDEFTNYLIDLIGARGSGHDHS